MRVLVVGAVADFRSTGGQGQVLGVDGVRHIQRGEALGQELCQVEIDHWTMVLVDYWRRGTIRLATKTCTVSPFWFKVVVGTLTSP